MSNTNDCILTIRMKEEEKKRLEEKAQENAMTISQYMRYIALEEEYSNKVEGDSKNDYVMDFLQKNIKMLTRISLETYLNVKELSVRLLDQNIVDDLDKEAVEVFRKLKIDKQNDKYYMKNENEQN